MLFRWKRVGKRGIGSVGRLEIAVGIIVFQTGFMRPRLRVDENRDIERVLRSEHRVLEIGPERHIGSNETRGGNAAGHAGPVVVAFRTP